MIVSIVGTNQFLMSRDLRDRVQSFVTMHGDLAYERLDGEGLTYDRLMEAIQSLPFLASSKLVVIRDLGAQKLLTEKIEQIVAGTPESTELILYESKIDKRLSYYKQLKKLTDCHEYAELDERGLVGWIVEDVVSRGGTIKRTDAQFLVERVGPKHLMLVQELEKLLIYNPVITQASIERLVEPSPQSSIFDMLDTIFRGDSRTGMKRYEEIRAQGEEPQKILAMISWQMHSVLVVKAAGQRSADTIAKEAGLSPYVVRKTLDITRRISMKAIKELVMKTATLDMRLKSEPIDPDQAVRSLLLTISNSLT